MHLYTSVLKVKYIAKSNEEERAGGRCLQNFFFHFVEKYYKLYMKSTMERYKYGNYVKETAANLKHHRIHGTASMPTRNGFLQTKELLMAQRTDLLFSNTFNLEGSPSVRSHVHSFIFTSVQLS